jgi:hypothetical protein
MLMVLLITEMSLMKRCDSIVKDVEKGDDDMIPFQRHQSV